MLYPATLKDLLLTPDLFYTSINRTFFISIENYLKSNPSSNEILDPMLICIEANKLDPKITSGQISQLTDGVPKSSPQAMAKLVEKLVALSQKRELWKHTKKLEKSLEEGDDGAAEQWLEKIRTIEIGGATPDKRSLADEVRDWVGDVGGEFSIVEIYKDLSLRDKNDHKNTSVILGRMVKDGLLRRSGKLNGRFRRVDKDCDEVDWRNAPTESLPFTFPLDIHDWVNIYGGNVIVIAGSQNSGKGHPHGTLILTPSGWKKIEELKVGDFVFAKDGAPSRVTGVFHRGPQQCFNFIFNDRTSIVCDWEHLWTVKKSRNSPDWETFPAYKVLALTNGGRLFKSQRIMIPKNDPLVLPRTLVPINAYMMGLLLGDGCLTKSTPDITTSDAEIRDWLVSRGWHYTTSKPRKNDKERKPIFSVRTKNLGPKLERMGLRGKYSWEKFIPKEYLYNAQYVRHGILCGLMDTDGDLSENGRGISFSSTSKQLAEDVAFLVRSLGGRVTMGKQRFTNYFHKGEYRKGRESYRLQIMMDYPPFLLPRKRDRYRPRVRPVEKTIKRIENAGLQDTICLSIDHPSGLYIAQDFIVTHNTAFCLNFSIANQDIYEINYFTSEMGATETKIRLELMDIPPDQVKVKFWERTDNFEDAVQPDAINIIDFLELNDEFYKVGSRITHIYEKLKGGIAVIALQKDINKEYGRGGSMGLERPRLYLAMNPGLLKIVKAKNWRGLDNPNGMTREFKLVNGWNFIPQGPWKRESYKEGYGETKAHAKAQPKGRFQI